MSDLPPPLSDVSDDYFPSGEATPQEAAAAITPSAAEQDASSGAAPSSAAAAAGSTEGGEAAAGVDDSTLAPTTVARVEPSRHHAAKAITHADTHPPPAAAEQPLSVCSEATTSSLFSCGGRVATPFRLHDAVSEATGGAAAITVTATGASPVPPYDGPPAVIHSMMNHMVALTAVSILYLEPLIDAYVAMVMELLEAPPTMDRLLDVSARLAGRAQHAVVASAHRIEVVLGVLLVVITGATVLMRWRFRKYDVALQVIRQQAQAQRRGGCGGASGSSSSPNATMAAAANRQQGGGHQRAASTATESGISSWSLET